jgi:hypothetical protein
VGQEIFNPSLAGRIAKKQFDEIKEGRKMMSAEFESMRALSKSGLRTAGLLCSVGGSMADNKEEIWQM